MSASLSLPSSPSPQPVAASSAAHGPAEAQPPLQPTQLPAAADWQQSLRTAYRSLNALAAANLLPPQLAGSGRTQLARFAICVPRALADRFDAADLAGCPLYRQAVPWTGEEDPTSLPPWAEQASRALYGRRLPWSKDPIGDVAHLAAPRLTHRYRARALLHVTSACALYCRYCFRKSHLALRPEPLYGGALAPAIAYLKAHPGIAEVVVTGGDPLTMPDAAWRRLLTALATCPGLRVVRVHTRMPSVLPERLTAELAATLAASRLQVVVACHANHPREWGAEARAGLARLRRAGISLLHQAVLLAGINDRPEVLAALWQQAYELGALPFYLHHPDWAEGTWGYRLPIARGRALMASLAGEVAGPALPRYVLDVPGGAGKVDLVDHNVVQERAWGAEMGVAGALWRLARPSTLAHQPVNFAAEPAAHASGEGGHGHSGGSPASPPKAAAVADTGPAAGVPSAGNGSLPPGSLHYLDLWPG